MSNKNNKNKKVLLGLSGGVDSAVAGYLLKEEGYDVTAGFMINYISDDDSCSTKIDLEEAKKVAKFLDIPFFTFDFVKEYNNKIVKYIYDGYKSGITPNPDVLCNSLVKFGLFLDEAIELGFDYVATGHYARIVRDKNNNILLKKGLDPNKDQSYFLSGLNRYQLEHSLFPIGELEKSEVRKIAKKINLPNADRKDSQGICFIGKVGMKEFLSKKIKSKTGDILDTKGNIIGQHNGAFSYTIGQRRGINIGGGPALFVVSKDIKNNTITVGTEKELALFNSSLTSSDFTFLVSVKDNKKLFAKIRYRQPDQDIELNILEKNSFKENTFKVEIKFKEPQRAISSGQVVVVYDVEGVVVGSGIID